MAAANRHGASISALLIAVLDQVWEIIRVRHPDVPEVVITLGSGSAGRSSSLKLGHFAADRWQRGDGRLHELFVGGEGLERGAQAVLGTLLHEAAHGIAVVRGIKDTSRQGRWHNVRFRDLAAEVGIETSKVPSLGWSKTSVTAATARTYQAELRRLEVVLVAFRLADSGNGRRSSDSGLSARCECGRRIRVSPAVLTAGPIMCSLCDTEFSAPPAS